MFVNGNAYIIIRTQILIIIIKMNSIGAKMLIYKLKISII